MALWPRSAFLLRSAGGRSLFANGPPTRKSFKKALRWDMLRMGKYADKMAHYRNGLGFQNDLLIMKRSSRIAGLPICTRTT